jgi:hypothetical protein
MISSGSTISNAKINPITQPIVVNSIHFEMVRVLFICVSITKRYFNDEFNLAFPLNLPLTCLYIHLITSKGAQYISIWFIMYTFYIK